MWAKKRTGVGQTGGQWTVDSGRWTGQSTKWTVRNMYSPEQCSVEAGNRWDPISYDSFFVLPCLSFPWVFLPDIAPAQDRAFFGRFRLEIRRGVSGVPRDKRGGEGRQWESEGTPDKHAYRLFLFV